jgi:pseudaminic acid cytidylyltransferase
MASSKSIAVIPARGGSRRLERKNVLPFMGKPMVAHTILAARDSGLFDRVLVSSDDSGILGIAEQFGAETLIRPHSLSDDSARVVDVCLHALSCESEAGRDYEVMVCLYATAPLRGADDIRAVASMLEPGVCDFAMAVTPCMQPAHQALKVVDGGFLRPMWPQLVNLKSQEVPPLMVDNGSTYAVTVTAFLKAGSFYGPNLRGYRMPFRRSVDIDTREDLDLASYFASRMNTP